MNTDAEAEIARAIKNASRPSEGGAPMTPTFLKHIIVLGITCMPCYHTHPVLHLLTSATAMLVDQHADDTPLHKTYVDDINRFAERVAVTSSEWEARATSSILRLIILKRRTSSHAPDRDRQPV